MTRQLFVALPCTLSLALAGCEPSSHDGHDHDHGAGTHTHADGSTHADHDAEAGHDDHDHDHEEIALPSATIGDMVVELAQAHGPLVAGEEAHLVVKLPYTDQGATIVRAWIGSEDRTLSFVGRGEYAASHDDYDIHAMAPDPLPEGSLWWIEIEKPDGETVFGSAQPLTE